MRRGSPKWLAAELAEAKKVGPYTGTVLPKYEPGKPNPVELPSRGPGGGWQAGARAAEGGTFEGYAAYPTGKTSPPGTLVGHTWTGLGDTERLRAQQLASPRERERPRVVARAEQLEHRGDDLVHGRRADPDRPVRDRRWPRCR